MPTSSSKETSEGGPRTGMFRAPVLEPALSGSRLRQIPVARWTGILVLALAPICPASAQEASSTAAAQIENPVAQQGPAAMERLKEAVSRQKANTASGPTTLPAPPDAQRRRAFEGLRARTPSPVLESQAREGLEKAREGMAAEREAMARRMAQALGLDAPDQMPVADAGQTSAPGRWVPVLFVSSSMPVPVLRTYAAQLEKAGGVMALRGMPGGLTHVGPMAKLSAQVLRIDPGCEGPACAMRGVQIIVDPLVFRQHGVTRVPALAMSPGDPAQPYCERDDTAPVSPHVVYGDAALSGMLGEYARLGGKKEVRDAADRLEPR